MNKYQKALNDLVRVFCIKRKSCDECKIRKVCNSEAKSYIDTLQELVDKVIPKKVIEASFTGYGEVEFTALCPKCNVNLGYESMNFYKYCPRCGQALDFSEAEEDDEFN